MSRYNPEEVAKYIGYKPNKWQREVQKSNARNKVIVAGRRSGKSLYVTFDPVDGLVNDLVSPPEDRRHVWIVAPNYDLTQRVWNELYTLVNRKFSSFIKGKIKNTRGYFKLETVNNTIIEAKSADEPEKLVGAGLTKVIIDEAAMVSKKAWVQSLRPTLIDFKGRALFISTPKGKNWFYDIYLKGMDEEQKEWKSWRFSTYDNDLLDRKEIESVVRDMPQDEYMQEIMAEFQESAEQRFRNVRGCIEGEWEDPKPGELYTIGIDLGRKSSYSVIKVIKQSNGHLVHFQRFKTVDWKEQKRRIKEVCNTYDNLFARIDSTGIGDPVIEELEDDGIRVEHFQYTEKSKMQLIDKLALAIEQERISYPEDGVILNELERFGRHKSPITGKVTYRALSGNDDCVNALALAVWDMEFDIPEDSLLGLEPVVAHETYT